MSEVSIAYRLAETIHGSLFSPADDLSPEEVRASGVTADIPEPRGTERLYISGEIEGHQVYQHLSKSRKNGNFYLSTVFTAAGGEVRRTRITPESSFEVLPVLESTLFVRALRAIADSRKDS